MFFPRTKVFSRIIIFHFKDLADLNQLFFLMGITFIVMILFFEEHFFFRKSKPKKAK